MILLVYPMPICFPPAGHQQTVVRNTPLREKLRFGPLNGLQRLLSISTTKLVSGEVSATQAGDCGGSQRSSTILMSRWQAEGEEPSCCNHG